MKVLSVFTEFFDLLEATFVKPAIIIFERYKLLSRKQKDRESYQQFWGALSNSARTCEIELNPEQEWIRDVFFFTIGNCDLQWRLLSGTLNPVDALSQAIVDEKGFFSHQKLTNLTKANNSFNNNGEMYKKNINPVKIEPSLNIEKSNSRMKCGNAFTKGHKNV